MIEEVAWIGLGIAGVLAFIVLPALIGSVMHLKSRAEEAEDRLDVIEAAVNGMQQGQQQMSLYGGRSQRTMHGDA